MARRKQSYLFLLEVEAQNALLEDPQLAEALKPKLRKGRRYEKEKPLKRAAPIDATAIKNPQ